MNVEWSANWDDDLGGSREHAARDVMLKGIEDKVKMEFEQTFMFYLPRICEHCLNPSCAASCPSGAIYKRAEDGIVLVDQDRCRGWRMCVSGCPYKKIYFNHQTGKAEKCTFCYPRVEVGLPTVCAETCVGRLRYIGLVLYDADKVLEAASVEDEHDLYDAQRACFLDPDDPAVAALPPSEAGIPGDWIEAAKRSPVWALINRYEVALPLHPEYRTMPMVWYIPPLSPVVDVVRDTGHDAEDHGNLFAAIDALRIPVEYLANLFTAGDVEPVNGVLRKLAAMRSYMRDVNLGREPDALDPGRGRHVGGGHVRHVPAAGASPSTTSATSSRRPTPSRPTRWRSSPPSARSASTAAGRARSSARARARSTPVAVENFQMLKERQTSDTLPGGGTQAGPGQPAQLGRQGHARGALPAQDGEAVMFRLSAATRVDEADPRTRSAQPAAPSGRPARRCLDYPTAELLGRLDDCPGRGRRPAGAVRRARCGGVVDHLRCHRPARAAGGLRRDLRPHPALRALPHLLRLRRHPPARRGAGAVQAGLPSRRACELDRRRSCPTTCAWCWSSARPSTRTAPGGCCSTTAPGWRCCAWRWREAGSPWATRSMALLRHPAAAARRRGRGRAPAGRARGPRPRRSASQPYLDRPADPRRPSARQDATR